MRIKSLRYGLSAALLAVVLSGCGGGSSTASAPTLGGVAAVGVPIVSGSVSVTCAGGSGQTTTSSTGSWTVSSTGLTLPCAVRVSGGTVGGAANTTPYHSVALSFGTVNITPLTDLVVAQMLGTAPATWFASPSFSNVSSTAINTALGTVSTNLGLATALGTSNPFTTTFAAQTGDKLDAILEAIKTTLTNLGKAYSTLLAAAQANSYATDFSNFASGFSAVYVAPSGSTSGTGTGSGATSCASGEKLLVFNASNSVSSSYTNGQGVCFSGNSTALTFLGKTLTSVVQGTPSGSFTISTFTDSSNSYQYEVVFDTGVLYEINLLVPTSQYAGQFAHAASLALSVSGGPVAVSIPAISPVTLPLVDVEFCQGVLAGTTLNALKSGGATLTVNTCTFANNVGNVALTASITGLPPISYSVVYTYTPL